MLWGEISRLKLLLAVGQDERNVTQLIAATGLSQANASKRLRVLTQAGLPIRRKIGMHGFYLTPAASVFKLCETGKPGLRY